MDTGGAHGLLAPGKWRQEDQNFKDILSNTVSRGQPGDTEDPDSKPKETRKKRVT